MEGTQGLPYRHQCALRSLLPLFGVLAGVMTLELTPERAFAVLGLTPGCSRRDIRRRFAELARRWHPDRTRIAPDFEQEANARMAEINAAYQVAKRHAARSGPGLGARKASPHPARFSVSGFIRPWRIFECEPGTIEWRELRGLKLFVLAGVVAALAALLLRTLPASIGLWVWGVAAAIIIAAAVYLLRDPKE